MSKVRISARLKPPPSHLGVVGLRLNTLHEWPGMKMPSDIRTKWALVLTNIALRPIDELQQNQKSNYQQVLTQFLHD